MHPRVSRMPTFTYPESYQLCAVFSSKLMVLTGKVSLCTTAAELLGVNNTDPGAKVSVLNGRRGPRGPGPGRELLMRCALCRRKPREPMQPTSREVFCPKLFCTEPFQCWTY